MIDLASTLAACRLLHEASLIYLWGAAAFLSILVPRSLAGATWHWLGRTPIVAVTVAAATTAAFLPLEVGMIGDGWSSAIDVETMRDVLLETTVGWAWSAQAIATILLIAALYAPRQNAPRQIAAIATASALSLACLTLTGHASMHPGWLGALHRSNDVIHLLSGGAWLGALVPLLPILGWLSRPQHHADAQLALRRFSLAGHAAVGLVILSGIVNVVFVLGRIPTDWSSPYQVLLTAKIALVACMASLAIINRYVFVPRMSTSPASAIKAIRTGSIIEIVIGAAVLALVAFFGLIEPV